MIVSYVLRYTIKGDLSVNKWRDVEGIYGEVWIKDKNSTCLELLLSVLILINTLNYLSTSQDVTRSNINIFLIFGKSIIVPLFQSTLICIWMFFLFLEMISPKVKLCFCSKINHYHILFHYHWLHV